MKHLSPGIEPEHGIMSLHNFSLALQDPPIYSAYLLATQQA